MQRLGYRRRVMDKKIRSRGERRQQGGAWVRKTVFTKKTIRKQMCSRTVIKVGNRRIAIGATMTFVEGTRERNPQNSQGLTPQKPKTQLLDTAETLIAGAISRLGKKTRIFRGGG